MSAADRALEAAARLDYGGAESRALLRMGLDADHDSGENCTTSLARIHATAGYRNDGGKHRSAGRALKRFIADGVVRVDVDAIGVGRLMTVCPVAEWSGEIAPASSLHRRIAAWQRKRSTPDVYVSGVTGHVHPRRLGVGGSGSTPDTTPDTTPDVKTSGDQRTNGPTPTPTSTSAVVVEEARLAHADARESGDGDVIDITARLAAAISMADVPIDTTDFQEIRSR